MTAGLFLQPGGHLADGCGHLGNVFDLAVHHHPLGVKAGLHGLHTHPVADTGAKQSDDAAGADIQGVDQVLPLRGERSGSLLFSHRFGSSFLKRRTPGRGVRLGKDQYLLKRFSSWPVVPAGREAGVMSAGSASNPDMPEEVRRWKFWTICFIMTA